MGCSPMLYPFFMGLIHIASADEVVYGRLFVKEVLYRSYLQRQVATLEEVITSGTF